MISHFHRELRGCDGAVVAVRYFSLECELAAVRGVRIPQVSLTLRRDDAHPDSECVDPDPDTLAWLERDGERVRVRDLLNRLAGRFDGRPMGELAVAAAGLLGEGEDGSAVTDTPRAAIPRG